MKTNFMSIFKYLAAITIITAVFASCKKDDPDPDYVGTWVSIGTVSLDGSTSLEVKDVLKLSRNQFDQVQQAKNSITNNWVSLIGMKGTLTVQANKLNITVTEAGQSSVSTITQLPTGQIEYLNSNDADFDDFLAFIEIPSTFVSEYVVNGNEITLKTDLNGDSDFNDLGEMRTYTRQ